MLGRLDASRTAYLKGVDREEEMTPVALDDRPVFLVVEMLPSP